MTTPSNKLVRFDWAMKYLLRDKANFDILEGFLTALLQEDITILELLESESNASSTNTKFNRVDLLVADQAGRRLIIEVQNTRESDYLERLLFGTSKAIVEHHELGQPYRNIKKVISISIHYFNLGRGDDYLYHGHTQFIGMNTQTPLVVKERIAVVTDIEQRYQFQEKNKFPEYYLIRVEKFEDVIQQPIDEWIYMLKHSEVKADFSSKHITQAEEKLRLLNMTPEERKQYEQYLMDVASEEDVLETAKKEGEEIGLKKGEEIGERKNQIKVIQQGLANGLEIPLLALLTQLSEEEVSQIIQEHLS